MNEEEVNTEQLNWDDESNQPNEEEFDDETTWLFTLNFSFSNICVYMLSSDKLFNKGVDMSKYKFYGSETVRYEVIIEADTEEEAFEQYEGLDVRKDSEVSREYFTTNKVERLTEWFLRYTCYYY